MTDPKAKLTRPTVEELRKLRAAIEALSAKDRGKSK